MASQTTDYITGDAAFAVDRAGVIVSWNSTAEKTFNYPRSYALGRRCWQLLKGQDLFGNRYCCDSCPVLKMALKHESVHSFQLLLKKASKRRENFSIHCLSVYNNGGRELLLHICNAAAEDVVPTKNNHAVKRPQANLQKGSLTPRELEVVALLAEGKTTRQISSTLHISSATVRNHIQNTLHKLHVHTRLEAVLVSQSLDLI